MELVFCKMARRKKWRVAPHRHDSRLLTKKSEEVDGMEGEEVAGNERKEQSVEGRPLR